MNNIRITVLLIVLCQIMGCVDHASQGDKTSGYAAPNSTRTSRFPLLLSTDFGLSWENAGDGLPADLRVSFVERKGDEILVATENSGLFLSSNNRTQWKQLGTGLPLTGLPDSKITALHVTDDALFIGIYEKGIYSSRDGGHIWSDLNGNLPDVNVRAIHQLGDSLLVGTDNGLFILGTEALGWQPTAVDTQVSSIYAHSGVLVAGTSKGTAVSKSRGKSWEWVSTKGAVHYTHPVGRRMFELALNGDVRYSDDWGQNWAEADYRPRDRSYVYEIARVGDYLLMSNNYGIHRSQDGGQNWVIAFPTEKMCFFDFLVIDDVIYGGTRNWDEYRGR